MEKNYSTNIPSNNSEGPSDLTIKRNLAFSKAMNIFNGSQIQTIEEGS